jgi:hypothetical protein
MSNEIAHVDDSALELLPPAHAPSVNAQRMLITHAQMMNTAYELASKMVNTRLVPARFFGKADDATAAILYGAELGLNPIQSLQRVIPIYGMPTLEARTMVALLKSRGYKIKTLAQSDDSVTVRGTDLGGEEYESTWTIERATKAGYVPEIDDKTGKFRLNAKGNLIGNEKYLTDPQAMLKAKAQAEVCRDMAPEVLIGISYTAEELESERFDHAPPAPVRPSSAPITVEEIFADPAAPAQAAEETPQPDAGDDQGLEQPTTPAAPADAHQTDEAPPAEVPDVPASAAQNRKMHALFRQAGLTDRQDRLIVTGEILGYSLDTSAKLTGAEANTIIDTLEAWFDSTAPDIDSRITNILQDWAARQADE